jgi:CRP-like cAMP-binding protein
MSGAWPVSLRRLASFAPLSPCDELLVKQLKPQTLPSNSLLSEPLAQNELTWIVLSGWCARVRFLADGQRQIIHLLLPGDILGAGAACWAGDRLPAVTLTPAIVADAAPLRAVVKLAPPEHARLIEACERAAWCEQAYCLNAIVRLGQQSAYQRLAHLLLEIQTRLDSVGLAGPRGFQLPVTQGVLAHTLGLSLVHLSRTLRQMRKEGLIAFQPGRIELLKPDVLAVTARFPHTVSWLEQSA